MAHAITESCIGCTACVNVCPVDCITGDRGIIHSIDANICIDCGVCGRVCPADSIYDGFGNQAARVRRNIWPKPVVLEDMCSGCTFCVDICPFDCLAIRNNAGSFHDIVELVDPKACVGCFLCEDVCLKRAIIVLAPGTVPEPEEGQVA